MFVILIVKSKNIEIFTLYISLLSVHALMFRNLKKQSMVKLFLIL